MTKAQIKEKLEKEDKGTFVIEIIHKNKKYVQAIKPTKKSFEYIYYEIKDNYFVYSYPTIQKNTCYKKVEWKYTCPSGYTLKGDKCYK